jgi:hypothetical protein
MANLTNALDAPRAYPISAAAAPTTAAGHLDSLARMCERRLLAVAIVGCGKTKCSPGLGRLFEVRVERIGSPSSLRRAA